jgi:hypothetical protein
MPHLAVELRGAASVGFCGLCYGVTKLTDVPQFAKPFLVPPQVPMVRVNCGGVQFGDWMYSLAK